MWTLLKVRSRLKADIGNRTLVSEWLVALDGAAAHHTLIAGLVEGGGTMLHAAVPPHRWSAINQDFIDIFGERGSVLVSNL